MKDTPAKQTTPIPSAEVRDSSPIEHHATRLQSRKYFDSGDYALARTAANSSSPQRSCELPPIVGRLHPSPGCIEAHLTSSTSGELLGKSPMKDHIGLDGIEDEGWVVEAIPSSGSPVSRSLGIS